MSEPMAGTQLREVCMRAIAPLRRLIPRRFRSEGPVIPVVRLTGVIGMSAPLRPGLSLAGVARTLDRAFGMRNAAAVALVINSPGGSPVQSHLIYRRIRELAAEKDRRVLAFVEDAAASGGYMIACAADEIIADEHSIVGSIGVVGGSFGFEKAIAKLGIERRLYTSGDHKAMLDPFLPENPGDVERLKNLQREIHHGFIELVKSRRRGKLNGPEDELFSGAYWTGRRGLEFGIVDAIGDLRTVLRERFGNKVVTPLISVERGWLGRRVPGVGGASLSGGLSPAGLGAAGLGAAGLGAAGLADELISAIEARALWARYGL